MNTEQEWSTPRTYYVDFTEYLINQIRTRYAMYERPVEGKLNPVIDSFVPRLFVSSNLNMNYAKEQANLPKTACAISPWFASTFNVKQIPTEQLCLILGYTKKDLTTLLKKVKTAKYSVSFIGYGGTNVNTLHWLSEISKFTNVINIFNESVIYEDDYIDVSNLIRFPKNPSATLGYNHKLELLEDELTRLSYKTTTNRHYWRDYYGTLNKDKQHIFYGAPNIETRISLSKLGGFISATHGNASCSLHLNPIQDTSLQVESYGVIQLSNFFMNQLRMAIGFLEILADPSFDPLEQNKELLEFSFDGTAVRKADRNYAFQLNHDGLITPETGVTL